MKRRVVITGIGAVSPLGLGGAENWRNIKEGRSGLRDAPFPGSEAFPHAVRGVIDDFSPEQQISNRKLLKLMNRESQLIVTAAGQAMADAEIRGDYPSERTGIYLGTGLTSGELGDLLRLVEDSTDETGLFSYRLMGERALPGCNPLLSFRILTNMPVSYLSIIFGIRGPNLVFNPWSSRTAQAIGEGLRAIRYGDVDCAVVGGGDSKSHAIGFLTFAQRGLLSRSGVCTPFGAESDGLVLSEGAAILVLEEMERAQNRGARIYAEITGYGSATDTESKGLFSEDEAPLMSALERALSDSGIRREEVAYVCASANSHPVGDMTEAKAIAKTFSEGLPCVTSLKAFTGDMGAGASAYSLAICAYALAEGVVPPFPSRGVKGYPGLSLCGGAEQSQPFHHAMVNAFELGEAKVSFVLRRWPG
ncbi:MAG: beta-ketoacyl-[acyl-carrier-protein] synthase family protein [Nitrospirales bacterium]|nr:beta-ketoacyl-[acyl-carrier-protein] synthase family protein [Nitrospirales bacterium]